MSLKQSIIKHVEFLDSKLQFALFTGSTLKEWITPLLNAILDNGSISYLIDENGRYRASPLSSAIEWLSEANLLPLEALSIMQERLIYLRDNNEANDPVEGNRVKILGDEEGWSLSEGVSVWSTSLAIIAMLDNHDNWVNYFGEIKKSVLWLCEQRNVVIGGWGYQNINNCEVNTVCTSLALRAIAKTLRKCNASLSSEEKRKLAESLTSGYTYLKSKVIIDKKRNYAFWEYLDKPNCAATTWSLLAFFEAQSLASDLINDDFATFFGEVKEKSIDFILSTMPTRVEKWCDEQIVNEAGAKYNRQKNYYSFSSTLLPQLFIIGISPYHPKVINQIRWLIDNPSLWKITSYDKGSVCSFTYAMIISTLVQWAMYVGKTNSILLLEKPYGKAQKISCVLFGYYYIPHSPVQMIKKQKFYMLVLIILLLIILSLFGKQIYAAVHNVVAYLISLCGKEIDSIVINIISSFLYAALVISAPYIYNIIQKLFRR